MTRKNVLFCSPVFQSVYPKPYENFLAMMLVAGGERERYSMAVSVPGREILHDAMNRTVGKMLEEGYDAMIMVDDDCLPPIDAIPRLLRHFEAGHPFVAGMGYMRGFPHTTTIGRYFKEGISIFTDPMTGAVKMSGFAWVDDVSSEPDLVPADFCGFPIAMVSADAFRKMERPWFGTHTDEGGCTHDVFFGLRAKAAGIPILVDKTMDCGHMIESPIVNGLNRDRARAMVPGFIKGEKA